MAIVGFPPLEQTDENGLLALGGDLETESLLLAYSNGIFPWPISKEYPLAWFSPDPRGILFFENLHIPKSLKKFIKHNPYEVKFNTDFDLIIEKCAKVKRPENQGTWITEDIQNAYINLFNEGYAYCVGAYLNDELVGGVYGVCIHNFYSGESMFHTKDNASKVVLLALMFKLKELDITWLDTQMVTPVVEALGGIGIPREEYIKILTLSLSEKQ